jgi:hypothetical protein
MGNQIEATVGAVEKKTFRVGFRLTTVRDGLIEVVVNSAEEAIKVVEDEDGEHFSDLVEASQAGELYDWFVSVDDDEVDQMKFRDAFHTYGLTHPHLEVYTTAGKCVKIYPDGRGNGATPLDFGTIAEAVRFLAGG